jgi:hypothetical protein
MTTEVMTVDASELMKPGEILDRLLNEVLKPNAEELARIASRGEVAILACEPDADAREALEALRWRERPVFGITRTRGERMAKASTDHVWQRWAARPSNMQCLRIFVFVQSGTLLAHFTPGRGFWLEPNQGDAATLS